MPVTPSPVPQTRPLSFPDTHFYTIPIGDGTYGYVGAQELSWDLPVALVTDLLRYHMARSLGYPDWEAAAAAGWETNDHADKADTGFAEDDKDQWDLGYGRPAADL